MSIDKLQKYFGKKEIVPESAKTYTKEEIKAFFGCGEKKFNDKMGTAIKNGEWKIVCKRSSLAKRLYMPTK